jgi:hypothetical protein
MQQSRAASPPGVSRASTQQAKVTRRTHTSIVRQLNRFFHADRSLADLNLAHFDRAEGGQAKKYRGQ